MFFIAPKPLLVGRLIFGLGPSNGILKTVKNFTALCYGENGMCGNAHKAKIYYLGCPIHRVVESFVAQWTSRGEMEAEVDFVHLLARTSNLGYISQTLNTAAGSTTTRLV